MTKLIRLVFLVSFTLVVQVSFGQEKLFGTWTVSCLLERIDPGSVKVCSLCPVVNKDKSMVISDFEMNIGETEIKINTGEKTTSAKYNWDETLQTIEFQYEDYIFKFNVLSSGQSNFRVLKNSDGRIITLSKK